MRTLTELEMIVLRESLAEYLRSASSRHHLIGAKPPNSEIYDVARELKAELNDTLLEMALERAYKNKQLELPF